MIIVYKTIPNKEIRKNAKETIPQIEQWFKNHPDRKDCHVQVWYGKTIIVKPKTVAEQVNAAAEEACKPTKKRK